VFKKNKDMIVLIHQDLHKKMTNKSLVSLKMKILNKITENVRNYKKDQIHKPLTKTKLNFLGLM
jgi:hypothetical protein